jgi:hypothetical protein
VPPTRLHGAGYVDKEAHGRIQTDAGRTMIDIDIIAEGEVFFRSNRAEAGEHYVKTRHGQFRLKAQPLDHFLDQTG